MSKPKETGRPAQPAGPEISYRPTLETLRAQRRAPVFELHHTIGGGIEQSVHHKLDALRERRIAVMDNRLREVKGHIENEFAVSNEREHARSDFERSR